jgi:tripartite-type tricarboxylate transporter receptor subunit TctC
MFFNKLALTALTLLTGATLISSPAATAAAWPDGPVHVIVPFGAGSSPDTTARILSERLTVRLGQAFIVENKPGANGNIGTDFVARARPDGKTIGLSIAGPLGINAMLYKSLPYDTAKDLALITIATNQHNVVVVSANLGIANLKDLLTELRTNKPYNYGSGGVGSVSHLALATLVSKVGSQAVHVPYPGASKVVFSLLGNEVQFACLPYGIVASQIQAGKLRPIAVAGAERLAVLPGVPTLAESGFPEIQADSWIGYIAPAATPANIQARLQQEIASILKEPDVRKKLDAQFMEPVGGTSAEFKKVLQADVIRWKPIIEKNHITVD